MPRIVIALQNDYADWEPALLMAATRYWLDCEVVTASPDGKPVISMGGLKVSPDIGFDAIDAEQFDAERCEKLRHAQADITGADDQCFTPGQAARQTVMPALLDLGGQCCEQLALMGQQMAQHVLGHHLAEDAHGAGQRVVSWQVTSQQRRNAGPGRLQPLRPEALTQQGREQIRLAQP